MIKKVELLAPAGSYECFEAAVNAGADAVYLAGKMFGARSFANNFQEQELIRALQIAAIKQKKIYLTVNTLIKEKELDLLYQYLKPYYENGLTGVIIQDLGLLEPLKYWFPLLELHISTQVNCTGYRSAKLLYEAGVRRIVPARELSIDEIKTIKDMVPIELETFVHGAMCYSYSGQCLFSSFLGGRSGNRGKCAQPCRLPYQFEDAQHHFSPVCYPISLKDLYTLDILPKLIEAGIDSFKIEGRMKSPQYVAGTTAVYRKYIDRYYEDREHYKIEEKDRDCCEKLYGRSNPAQGYYQQHNHKNMITLTSSAYHSSNEDEKIMQLTSQYLVPVNKLKVDASILIHAGLLSCLTLSNKQCQIEAYGAEPQLSKNRPLDQENVEKQLRKTTDTLLEIQAFKYDIEDGLFMTIGELNELRRTACASFEKELLRKSLRTANPDKQYSIDMAAGKEGKILEDEKTNVSVSVLSVSQLRQVITFSIHRVYIPYDLFDTGQLSKEDLDTIGSKNMECFISFPRILRKRDEAYLQRLSVFLKDNEIRGVLVKNLEAITFLEQIEYSGIKISDPCLYTWNHLSDSFYRKYFTQLSAPLELNSHEIAALHDSTLEITAYGHLPMMVSANCVRKTISGCSKDASMAGYLVDRYQKRHPVVCNCLHCYSTLYNAVPLSIHRHFVEIQNLGFKNFRLDFTIENHAEINEILLFYTGCKKEFEGVGEFTTGHMVKGVL